MDEHTSVSYLSSVSSGRVTAGSVRPDPGLGQPPEYDHRTAAGPWSCLQPSDATTTAPVIAQTAGTSLTSVSPWSGAYSRVSMESSPGHTYGQHSRLAISGQRAPSLTGIDPFSASEPTRHTSDPYQRYRDNTGELPVTYGELPVTYGEQRSALDVTGPIEDEFPGWKHHGVGGPEVIKDYWPPGGESWNRDELEPPAASCCHHHSDNPPYKPSRRRSLTEVDFTYNMAHARRGQAVIINNKNFLPDTNMPRRIGSDVDVRNLTSCLSKLGFEVSAFDDMTARQMVYVMKNSALADHGDADCFVCVVLSHGDVDTVYGTDAPLTVTQLAAELDPHRCPTLAGKPKLFIIQAGRGLRFDGGTYVPDAADMSDGRGRFKLRLPTMGDFLFAYSCAEGYLSWRSPERGSWFVESLCHVLDTHGTTRELLWLLTRTNNMVATRFASSTTQPYLTGKKQMPSFVTMLAKHVYFTPKDPSHMEHVKAGASS